MTMMDKAVLISIRPNWCKKILSGYKTLEIRKTRPKLQPPFKCYIYQTMTGYASKSKENDILVPIAYGKVIGEFVCDNITHIVPVSSAKDGHKSYFGLSEYGWMSTCLTPDELIAYGGEYKELYGWHISDLVIYDKPKELTDFKGRKLVWRGNNHVHAYEQIERPPQSWCYLAR